MSGPYTCRYYWLPFPGQWQAVLRRPDGRTAAEGMAPTKPAALAAAERNAARAAALLEAAAPRAL